MLEKLRPHAVPVQPEVENSSYLAARQVTISVDAFQTEQVHETPADEAVERLVDRGPDMFLGPAEEKEGRNRALADSVRQAEQQGLSAEGAYRCAIYWLVA